MSFPLPFGSSEFQPQVRLETFEDLTTARRAVGEVRGFDDPITAELLDDTRHAFDRGNYEFQPKTYVGDEAKVIVRALKTVAKSREDELAVSAADALSRVPLQLRAATFISSIFKPESTIPAENSTGPRFPLFDPNATEKRPPVEWKSKYDQSHKGKRF